MLKIGTIDHYTHKPVNKKSVTIDGYEFWIANDGKVPEGLLAGLFDCQPESEYAHYISPNEVILKNEAPDLEVIENDMVGLCEDNEVMKECIKEYFEDYS